MTSGKNLTTSLLSEPNVLSTIGNRFSKAVSALDTKSSISFPKSASGFDKPATRFSHDVFVIANEPCKVSAASLAVVPVMPISVCTTWIASTMSA